MNIRECYEAFGGDYEGALDRLYSENVVEMIVLKFPEDDSFRLLEDAMNAGDYEAAFLASHTLKGVCANLGFTKLQKVSDQLTEELREGRKPEDDSLFDEVRSQYNRIIECLNRYETG